MYKSSSIGGYKINMENLAVFYMPVKKKLPKIIRKVIPFIVHIKLNVAACFCNLNTQEAQARRS